MSSSFETSDGQKREEHAQVVIENDEPSQIISGSYSYFGDDGQLYQVDYTADKDGFHPQGAHIPKQPITNTKNVWRKNHSKRNILDLKIWYSIWIKNKCRKNQIFHCFN